MKLFQLFTEVPGDEFLGRLLACYGLSGLQDSKEFCKEDLIDLGTINKLEELVPEMILYYLPCKSQIYLKDITLKRSITILSQFLKLFEHKLSRKERIISKKKHIYYKLINIKFSKLHISNESTAVEFG